MPDGYTYYTASEISAMSQSVAELMRNFETEMKEEIDKAVARTSAKLVASIDSESERLHDAVSHLETRVEKLGLTTDRLRASAAHLRQLTHDVNAQVKRLVQSR